MKITGYKLFPAPPRELFLKIETDEGIVGWGEPVLEGKTDTAAACVVELMEYLVGKDPLQIERHWQRMLKGGFYRGGAIAFSAISGIDQALWDILGKSLGVPVHQLLGGAVRDRVRIYGHLNTKTPHQAQTQIPLKQEIEELREITQLQMDRGLTAFKFCPSDALEPIDNLKEVNKIVARVAAVREHIGDERDLMLDFHGRFSLANARRLLPLLEPFNLLFVEEPVLPEYTKHFGLIVESTPIPIATGERLFLRADFQDVLRTGLAVAQPDISHAGGISELRRIAAMAETYNVFMAPHSPLGPINLAASLQLDFATPNFLIQEQVLGLGNPGTESNTHKFVDYGDFKVKDGYVELMTKPGLGIEVDEEAVAYVAANTKPWRAPEWTSRDGALAEW